MKYKRLPWLAVAMCTSLISTAGASQTIKLSERVADEILTHTNGKSDDSSGDLLTFANNLFDHDNKRSAGRDEGFCVRTRPGKTWFCNLSLILSGGQITTSGPFLDEGNSVLVVVGGSGAYVGARGILNLHPWSDGKGYDFSIELQ
jgi:allene oxide cyclase